MEEESCDEKGAKAPSLSLAGKETLTFFTDMIFSRSPKVVLESADEQFLSEVGRLHEKCKVRRRTASEWQCYTRKLSTRQRDFHLERLRGAVTLEKLLRRAQESDTTTVSVYLYGQVRVWKGDTKLVLTDGSCLSICKSWARRGNILVMFCRLTTSI